jgi:NAD(P)-dependent dehydrogenase (short-subunit alcohol dehydrogenase family)
MTHTALNTNNLSDRVVVITGAGSGIGREVALLCARRGANLALCDVNFPAVEETAEHARALGCDVITAKVDVSLVADLTDFAESVHQRFGAVDLLVNNAGVAVIGGFLETSSKDWDWLVSINLTGVANGCHAFLPAMVERGHGQVVNVSSAAGLLANPQLAAYSATKFGVLGLSEALRMELAPLGIGVTAVCPGIINTPITTNAAVRGNHAADRRQNLQDLYAKRGYTAEKVALRILRGVHRNRAVVPIAAEAHAIYLLSRLAPPVARWASVKLANLAQ